MRRGGADLLAAPRQHPAPAQRHRTRSPQILARRTEPCPDRPSRKSPSSARAVGARRWPSGWPARGQPVTLWGHDPDTHPRGCARRASTTRYLPGVPLPPNIAPVADLADAAGSDLVIFVTPSRALREVAGRTRRRSPLAPAPVLLSCTKGIEFGTRAADERGARRMPAGQRGRRAVRSEPRGGGRAQPARRPSCSARREPEAAARLQALFNAAALRAYTSDDVAGHRTRRRAQEHLRHRRRGQRRPRASATTPRRRWSRVRWRNWCAWACGWAGGAKRSRA